MKKLLLLLIIYWIW